MIAVEADICFSAHIAETPPGQARQLPRSAQSERTFNYSSWLSRTDRRRYSLSLWDREGLVGLVARVRLVPTVPKKFHCK